jgi:hypothetical protein
VQCERFPEHGIDQVVVRQQDEIGRALSCIHVEIVGTDLGTKHS